MQAGEYDMIYIDPDDLHQKQNGTPLATRALHGCSERQRAYAKPLVRRFHQPSASGANGI